MTSLTKTSTALLAAIAIGCTTTACTSGNSEPAPTTSTDQPPLSGVGPAGRSPGQQATEGAIAAVKGMYSAEMEVSGDTTKDLNLLAQYTTDPYLSRLRDDITLRRSKGIVSEGEIRVIRTQPDEVTAPTDEDGNPVRGTAEVLLRTCVDVSTYASIDPEGNDTVDPNRLEQAQAIFRVVNDSWPAGDGWRVVENTLPTVEECDAY
ncbi:hypothetical protein G6031_04115 [Dietzia sp. CQ4]|uniref:hypothetical protein n=1 Tax=Dietzia sp. (strain CQ4) TaxID=370437 RepID=UPI0015FAFF8F|nr:hypothetical protein [Dietzia sp. CQ4]MBB1033574.1 hypothetical protein [Dietzia sp. CQ4]